MSEFSLEDLRAVPCDMCFGDVRKPARKTCTKCEISMCVEHLQAHLTTPVLLQTHPLTEPVAACATAKCPQHGKVLEYYCLDEMACVCVSCAIEGQHRSHDMKTFPTAHKELVEQLQADLQGLKVKESGDKSLERWEKSERERVCRSSARLIEAVTQLREVSLASVQSSVSARMESLRRGVSSVEAALKEEDALGFLQVCSQVRRDVQQAEAVDLRPGLEPGSPRDKLVEELQQKGEKMIQHAGQFLCDLLTLVDPENQSQPGGPRSNLTFDAKTLSAGMSLSEDKKKVFYSTWKGELSDQLLSIQRPLPVSNFQTWVIAVPKEHDWAVGLCDTSYAENTKGGQVYALRWQCGVLATLNSEYAPGTVVADPNQVATNKRTRPQKVEMVHDVKNCSLSFSSVTGEYQRVKLASVRVSCGNMALRPFVRLGKVPPQSNTYSKGGISFGMVSSDRGDGLAFGQRATPKNQYVSSSFAFAIPPLNQQDQNIWKCHCGQSYLQSPHGYTLNGRFCLECSCGAALGSPVVTELLCELL